MPPRNMKGFTNLFHVTRESSEGGLEIFEITDSQIPGRLTHDNESEDFGNRYQVRSQLSGLYSCLPDFSTGGHVRRLENARCLTLPAHRISHSASCWPH